MMNLCWNYTNSLTTPNGIDIEKGVDIKEIYPSGDMRVMGDADILVRFSDIDSI